MTRRWQFGVMLVLIGLTGAGMRLWPVVSARQQAGNPAADASPTRQGQSVTHLPDGRWLLLGGQGPVGAIGGGALFDPTTRTTTPLTAALLQPRAGHTATVLPDGSVLVVGGRNGATYVEEAEVFDPATGFSAPFAMTGSASRMSHTATLLTDGRVLVAGGANAGPISPPSEIWDLQARTAAVVPGGLDRAGHTATLQADGRVRMTGGRHTDGTAAEPAVIVDPTTSTMTRGENRQPDVAVPVVVASLPEAGATSVPLDTRVVVRFSEALRLDTLTAETIRLAGPSGALSVKVVGAEQGRLAFVWPLDPLIEGETYTLRIDGAISPRGVPLVPVSLSFTTVDAPRLADAAESEAWSPTADSARTGWRSGRRPSPWETLAPLMAPAGVTAISGRVLTLDGRPLPNVTLAMDGATSTESDRTGRFLLQAPSVGGGRHVLDIEGKSASRPGRTYGFFEYGMTVVPGRTTVLSFTIWMPKLDLAHAVRITSPTTAEVVVTTPSIPGLELHIPPQTVIRGEDGKPVTQISITAIPVDRPPFPLAKNVEVPVYFTIQPGGAYVQTLTAGPKGAQLVYPNYHGAQPGQRIQFFHYDPKVKDWFVYGLGTVSPNAAQVVPDPTARLYEFTGAMINDGQSPPAAGGTPGAPVKGDPLDPSTGVFLMHKTDLFLPDVMPLALTRTYNSGDTFARPFGRGMTHPYGLFLWSAHQYLEVDLILPEGGRVHYVRISPGTGITDAVFEHTTSPTAFAGSIIAWNGNGWNLKLLDGTVYVFGENAPLQAIQDRYGNRVSLVRAGGSQSGNITSVTSTNGRRITFTYDASNRITHATDNINRIVSYVYDANGNLSTVTDPENHVTTYTYDASNRMATIKDGRNIVYLTNQYTNGRVTQQTLADPNTTYLLAYTVDGSGNITQTDITDPRGYVERLSFDGSHYLVSDTEAFGTPLARTTTIERQAGSSLATATVDGLGRRTEHIHDNTGHLVRIKRLASTLNPVTTTFTYEAQSSQLATIADPMGHTWTFGYDANGRLTSVTDPLTHQTTIAINSAGQVTSVTDPLQHTSQFGYTGGDQTSIINPNGATWTRFVDGAGRVLAASDPLGRVTRTVNDKLNRVTSLIDPQGGQTTFTYDPNSQILSMTDALNHSTNYAYDSGDRVASQLDPLQNAVTYQYDGKDNLTQVTDRKGQITTYQYDALDRATVINYPDNSTTQFIYDAGDRATQIIDSVAGTIARGYDDFDHVTSETTPEGSISYTYDVDGRRATMTVAGQPQVVYNYDDAHRLTSISQGTATVGMTYDAANRQTTVSLPNNVVAAYGYDDANRLTDLTYTLGQTALGSLTYTYDAKGNRIAVTGSWARTALPQVHASATYDAANRLTTWAGQALSYDANGNVVSDGSTGYVWSPRNQLVGLNGATTATFQYDAIGRRRAKTVTGTTTFQYDGLSIVNELAGGAVTASFLTGDLDDVFLRTDANGTSVPLTDALGSTQALVAQTGVVGTQYTYEPFGSTRVSGPSSTNDAQFTGRENDENGLYYYRARYYSPTIQRFISEDPIGPVGGTNSYSYVGGNPVGFTDPLGLKRCKKPCDAVLPQDPNAALLARLLFAEASRVGITDVASVAEMEAIAFSVLNRVAYLVNHPRTPLSFFHATDRSIPGVINPDQYGSVNGSNFNRAASPADIDISTPLGRRDCKFLKRSISVADGSIGGWLSDPFEALGGTYAMRTIDTGSPGGTYKPLPAIPGASNVFFGLGK